MCLILSDDLHYDIGWCVLWSFMWSAVAGLAIKWARVRIPLCYRFEDWAFSFSPLTPLFTQLYKWVPGYRQWLKQMCRLKKKNESGKILNKKLLGLTSRWRAILVLCVAFFLEIGQPPRNANNIEPCTFVTQICADLYTPPPMALRNTLMASNARW